MTALRRPVGICSGIIVSVAANAVVAGNVHVGDGAVVSACSLVTPLSVLAETMARLAGSSSGIVYSALPIDDPKVRRPDTTRAEELLGWKPVVSLAEGLARVLEFERKHWSYTLTAPR